MHEKVRLTLALSGLERGGIGYFTKSYAEKQVIAMADREKLRENFVVKQK